ncbi:BAHD acyltransferase DCR [Vitis vinifera]|uniref:BAHD acyltransferase DCR n=2 Tax=Vitis vinifera TaxID=29760 RepID=A0A438ITF8_VITVI|nr:BAHD acyltransferase DCR [Vitis vinifera]
MMGSSPRFNKYGIEFGLGKGLAVRSGYAHKFDGKVSCYPGREGGGSIDLEVCLPPNSMSALESNQEFMEAVSLSP